jgi:hypothetical protein
MHALINCFSGMVSSITILFFGLRCICDDWSSCLALFGPTKQSASRKPKFGHLLSQGREKLMHALRSFLRFLRMYRIWHRIFGDEPRTAIWCIDV